MELVKKYGIPFAQTVLAVIIASALLKLVKPMLPAGLAKWLP